MRDDDDQVTGRTEANDALPTARLFCRRSRQRPKQPSHGTGVCRRLLKFAGARQRLVWHGQLPRAGLNELVLRASRRRSRAGVGSSRTALES